MIRSLLKLALLLVVGILIYNYFRGNETEQKQSAEIFGQTRRLVVSLADLMKSEKAKYDAGKYDKVLAKLGETYREVRKHAQNLDQKVLTRLDDLETKKARLQEELSQIEQGDQQAAVAARSTQPASAKTKTVLANKAADQQRRKAQLQQDLEQLLHESDQLLQEAQQ